MLQIKCHGTPYEIGHQHGTLARSQVHGSITFYKSMFQTSAQLTWGQVRLEAAKFVPFFTQNPAWTPLKHEMEGIAAGADVDFLDILALNVRTEIAYGMFSDGCTAFSWKGTGGSFLAQNWDWDVEQAPNLISLHIAPTNDNLPNIHMITEGGIIGKIGLNSSGVGVTLNAIKARGVDFNKIPCHLALRTVLNSHSRDEAVGKLIDVGVASACHITVADAVIGGMGLECSHRDIVRMEMDGEGVCAHTNHYLGEHGEGVVDVGLVGDSGGRLERVGGLIVSESVRDGGKGPSFEGIERVLEDEEGFPYGICRARGEGSKLETLFSVCMDLGGRKGRVRIGRPIEGGERLELRP